MHLVMEQDIIVFVMVLVVLVLLILPEEMRVALNIKIMDEPQDKKHIIQPLLIMEELKLKKEQFTTTGKQSTIWTKIDCRTHKE